MADSQDSGQLQQVMSVVSVAVVTGLLSVLLNGLPLETSVVSGIGYSDSAAADGMIVDMEIFNNVAREVIVPADWGEISSRDENDGICESHHLGGGAQKCSCVIDHDHAYSKCIDGLLDDHSYNRSEVFGHHDHSYRKEAEVEYVCMYVCMSAP